MIRLAIDPGVAAYNVNFAEVFRLRRDTKNVSLTQYETQATSQVPDGCGLAAQTMYLERIEAQVYRLRPGARTPVNGERVSFRFQDRTWSAAPPHWADMEIVFTGEPGELRRRQLLRSASELLRPDIARREKELNRVHLVYDEGGQRVFYAGAPDRECAQGGTPVLVELDEDDLLFVHVIAPREHIRQYRVSFQGVGLPELNTVLGTFAVPSGEPGGGVKNFRGGTEANFFETTEAAPGYSLTWADQEWTELVFRGGPFGRLRAENRDTKLYLHLPGSKAYTSTNGTETSLLSVPVRLIVHNLVPFELRLGAFGSFYNDRASAPIGNPGDREAHVDFAFTIVPYVWHWLGTDRLTESEGWLRVNPLIGFGLRDFPRSYYVGVNVEASRSVDVALGVTSQRVPIPQETPSNKVLQYENYFFVGVTFPADLYGRIRSALR